MSAVSLRSRTLELDDMFAVQEHFHSNGWTDGLPIVPPTEARVLAMLEGTARDPQEIVATVPLFAMSTAGPIRSSAKPAPTPMRRGREVISDFRLLSVLVH